MALTFFKRAPHSRPAKAWVIHESSRRIEKGIKNVSVTQPLVRFAIIRSLLSRFRAFRNGNERQSTLHETLSRLRWKFQVNKYRVFVISSGIQVGPSWRFIELLPSHPLRFVRVRIMCTQISRRIALIGFRLVQSKLFCKEPCTSHQTAQVCFLKCVRALISFCLDRKSGSTILPIPTAIYLYADNLALFQFTKEMFLFRCGRFSWVDCPWTQNRGNFTCYSELMR